MPTSISRRQVLVATSLASAAVCTAPIATPTSVRAETAEPAPRVRFCLNMSTVRGQKLTVPQQVEIAAQAGYDAIEPWMGDLDGFQKSGGKFADLRKQISDAGLTVESAIGFAQWIVDDDAKRKEGLDQAKRDMETLQAIGGKRIAAPPSGATDKGDLDLNRAADRYRALLELGDQMGIVPQLEVWGFSKSLSKLSEVVFIVTQARHPQACILPDVYHLYKGGSDFTGLRLLSGHAVQVFHMNDYPAEPSRDKINDSHRVYPGDGVAPLKSLLKDMFAAGFRGVLSLELFNRDYWMQDALTVAKTGLAKMKAAVAAAETK